MRIKQLILGVRNLKLLYRGRNYEVLRQTQTRHLLLHFNTDNHLIC